MTEARLVLAEPRIGQFLVELHDDHRLLERISLDGPRELTRQVFFHSDAPSAWPGACGRFMTDPGFKTYAVDAFDAYVFARVTLLNNEGVALLGDAVIRDTLGSVDEWRSESAVAAVHGHGYVRLRRPLRIARHFADGPYLIGFCGAWRNYGHWMLQCLPKLHSFCLLRQRLPGLRLALPELVPGSSQDRTLHLLGIRPGEVQLLPRGEATSFAHAVVVRTPDIWSIVPLVVAAAERLAAAVAAPSAGHERVYLHRRSGARRIGNFDVVRNVAERFGFVVRSFDATDLAEQIATMQAARFVITEHGAGSTNILFCRPGARVLELFNPYAVEPCFWSLASLRGLAYGFVVGACEPSAGQPPPDHNSDYVIPPDRLEPAIHALLGTSAGTPSPRPRPASSLQATGIVEPVFLETQDVSQFGQAGRHERLLLFPALQGPPAPPIVNREDVPPELLAEHDQAPPPLPVQVFAVAGATVWGNGLVTLEDRPVAPPGCVPRPVRGPTRVEPVDPDTRGSIDMRTTELDRPVAVTLPPNLTYASFLLDMLPRLHVAAMLRTLGASLVLALPARLPAWAEEFVDLLGLSDGVLRYDPERVRLAAPSVIWPARLAHPDGLHPAMNLLVEEIRDRARAGRKASPAAPRRLFLTGTTAGGERLENLAEVVGVMAEFGFTAVAPQPLGLAARLALIAEAEAVAGAFGDTLLEALFAPRGAKIIALDCGNQDQSLVARLRQQHLALVPPADGMFRHWRLPPSPSPRFHIDPGKLRQVARRLLAGAG